MSLSPVLLPLALLLALPSAQAAAQRPWDGDTAAQPLPIAAGLSPRLSRRDVSRAMRKVADWELNRSTEHFNQDWTMAALYTGFLAVPEAAGGQKYREAMLQMGKKFDWQPGPRVIHAASLGASETAPDPAELKKIYPTSMFDDLAVSKTYLDLHAPHRDPAMLDPTRAVADGIMKLADLPDQPRWWWCDSLFMAPPVFVKLSRATGERKYLDFMDHEWWLTSDLLYSAKDHLYFRDKSYLSSREASGKSIYWSRGNGWVFAALAEVIAEMPADYPSRPRYVAQFREMAQAIAALQGADGLWRPGLLDAASYPLPEVSGSAFFTYGFAWGINAGILDRKAYLPMVEKSWKGLLAHVYEDGRLGCVQPVGAAPGAYGPTDAHVYGTGAFLMAGSEIYKLAR